MCVIVTTLVFKFSSFCFFGMFFFNINVQSYPVDLGGGGGGGVRGSTPPQLYADWLRILFGYIWLNEHTNHLIQSTPPPQRDPPLIRIVMLVMYISMYIINFVLTNGPWVWHYNIILLLNKHSHMY